MTINDSIMLKEIQNIEKYVNNLILLKNILFSIRYYIYAGEDKYLTI